MNRRILLVDPDPAFQSVVNRELARYRALAVMIEPDRERAIARADPPALIAIAVAEPAKVGLKTFQKCRKSAALANVPMVLVTSSVAPESFAKHKGLKPGHADEYVDKRGLNPAELVTKFDK